MPKQDEKPVAEETAKETQAGADARRQAVRIKAGTLLKAVKDVADVVEGKTTIPILAFLLLEAGEGVIHLTGTNLDVWCTRSVASDDRDGPGSAEWVKSIRPFKVALPAKPLKALLSEFDTDAMVTVEVSETSAGQVAVRSGRGRYNLNSLPSDDFVDAPPFDVKACFELACTALADGFARVEHAMSSEEVRYYLNGCFLHSAQAEGEPLDMRLVATDGSRLARLVFDPPEGGASFPAAIIGKVTIGLLDKVLAEAAKASAKAKEPSPPVVLVESMGDSAGALQRFSLDLPDGNVVITAKTIDGTYPDYERVIPVDPPHVARVARSSLAEAIRRVSVLANEKTRAVRARFTSGMLELTATSAELGGGKEELACAYDGPEMTLGFDAKYWREALAAFATDEVSMGFDDSAIGPVLLCPVGADESEARFVQVLMPMRV